jgi:hypothetical protein
MASQLELSARAALCRELAKCEPTNRVLWTAEAENWSRLSNEKRRGERQAQGYVVPDAFTHGTSAQRTRWFMTGLKSGDIAGCNTFLARSLESCQPIRCDAADLIQRECRRSPAL